MSALRLYDITRDETREATQSDLDALQRGVSLMRQFIALKGLDAEWRTFHDAEKARNTPA